MIVKLIGIGAAGNKSAICAVENQVIKIEDTLLINSTLKDIPKDYSGKSIEFAGAYGGCGKERKLSYDLCMKSIQSGHLHLEEFLQVNTPQQAELVVITSSTEGGTGSGSAPIIAKYIRDVLGISVSVFAFTGFNDDVRGLKNTVEFFKEMQDDFGVQVIQNDKFLPECNDNKLKAERMANTLFSKKLSILKGNILRDSEHNIDATDLLKVATTEGFMDIELVEFNKMKNRDQFRKMVISMLDNSKSIDLDEPSQRRLAVIINIDEGATDAIDYIDIIEERLGVVHENFTHIQHESELPEIFAIISAGSKMPMDEITAIYEKYKERTDQVNKSKDAFFAESQDMAFKQEDDMFNLGAKKAATIDKADFFKKGSSASGFSNTKLKVKPVEDEY